MSSAAQAEHDSGTETEFAAAVAAAAGLPPSSPAGDLCSPDPLPRLPVRYVEDKHIDWRRVQEILSLSRRANHWTNFGPVSQALERALTHLLGLAPERSVVACASGTVGLAALAGLHAAKRGWPLRWVVSAYTFFNQRLGPFAAAQVVDCGDDGLIDLDAVSDLPAASWDGLVLTNLFGAIRDPRRYREFCRARGKALIVDAAAALLGPDRSQDDLPEEAISFHHTKPWGVGEGGCVIVARKDAATVKSILSFGIGGPDLLRPYSGNGKISDIACAAILDRLERLPAWSRFYRQQHRRIESLCRQAGLTPLLDLPPEAVPASVAVLAPRPVSVAALAHPDFIMKKYYPPLDRDSRNAARIFDRIVNVPCHPGMATLPDETIAAPLRRLAAVGPDGTA